MTAINRLVQALRCLPGVGPKSAQRMVYHLLQHQRERGMQLATCLEEAMRCVVHCNRCQNFTDVPLCLLCQDSTRDNKSLCVVESPADLSAIECSHAYQGHYFVLMGKISPLDGLGPHEIGLPKLKELIINEHIEEVILALSPTVEGQTTMYYIHDLLNNHPVRISQLAHGIPSGGELEFLDGHTITSALRNRSVINSSY